MVFSAFIFFVLTSGFFFLAPIFLVRWSLTASLTGRALVCKHNDENLNSCVCLFVAWLVGWLFVCLVAWCSCICFIRSLSIYKFNLVCKWHVHECTKKKHFTIIPERNAPILFSINACRDAQTTWQRHKAATECGLI